MDFQVWFNQIPFVSKFYLITVFLTTAVVSFGIINPYYLFLDFRTIWNKWQVLKIKKNYIQSMFLLFDVYNIKEEEIYKF